MGTHVDKWCEGVSPLLDSLARGMLDKADRLESVLEDLRVRTLIPENDTIDPVEWASLYDQPGRVCEALSLGLVQIRELSGLPQQLDPAAVAAIHLLPESVQVSMAEDMQEKVERMVLSIPGVQHGTDPEMDEDAHERVETEFFVRVLFPCWVEYGVDATDLIESARDELTRWESINLASLDKTAVEKLLRLDPLVIHEPMFARWHARLTHARHPSVASIHEWMSTRPSRQLSPQNIKYFCGAVISLGYRMIRDKLQILPPAMVKAIVGRRISDADIRRLYDAHARDTLGVLQDTDFSGSSEDTFRKGIQRYRDFVKGFMIPGQ